MVTLNKMKEQQVEKKVMETHKKNRQGGEAMKTICTLAGMIAAGEVLDNERQAQTNAPAERCDKNPNGGIAENDPQIRGNQNHKLL